MVLALFFLGLGMTALGSGSFVDHASALAKKLGLSPAVIGATVVSVGTTLPEIMVSLKAADTNPRIAAGIALGSVICNSALIGGLGALLMPAKGLNRRDLAKRFCFFLLAALFTAFSVSKTGTMGVGLGIILLSMFAVYSLTGIKKESSAAPLGDERPELICVGLIVGAAALYLGSGLIVDNGAILAVKLGLPERIAALTFISLGTSLPELATTVAAAVKKQGSLGLGNLVGANILDLLLVIGLPCVKAPMPAGADTVRDIWTAVGAMGLLTVPAVIRGKTSRLQGALLVFAYCAYCAAIFTA